LDSVGNIYGTTARGGSKDMGTIFTVDASGGFTTLHEFSGLPDGQLPGDLTIAPNGDLYGLANSGGKNNLGAIYRYSVSSGIESVLHNFGDFVGDGTGPIGPMIRDSSGAFYGTTSQGGSFGLPPGAIRPDRAGRADTLKPLQR
jgi:uncharacterized repeat protein (TIGR03803 family)